MAVVPAITSSGSGLNETDQPVWSSYPTLPVSSSALPAVVTPSSDGLGSSVNVSAQEYEKNKTSYMGLTPFSGETGSGLVDLNKMFDELTGKAGKIAMEQMEGKIPEDVQKQLRIMSAESSLGYGLGKGSQASKFVEARDLGLTSLDIQERGVQKAQAISQLAESKREFNKQYELNMAQFMQDVRKTDLSAAELMESSRQANVKNRLLAQELAANLVTQYHTLMSEYATPKNAGSFVSSLTSDVQNILNRVRTMV